MNLDMLADELYEAVNVATAGDFILPMVHTHGIGRLETDAELTNILSAQLLSEGLWAAILKVDRRRTDDRQLSLFESMDTFARLGGGRRVRRAIMVRDDVLQESVLEGENVAKVTAAFSRKQTERNSVLPYMTTATITWEAAVRAYRAVNT